MTSSVIQEACEGWKCTEEQISLEGWEYIKRELEKRIRSLKQAKLEQEMYSISTDIGIDARILERKEELKVVINNIEREKE